MARHKVSLKQLAIDKDNTTIVIVVALAAFLCIFSIVACKSLLAQSSFQSKVIKKKQTAVTQLKTNATEVKKLNSSYQQFASQPSNMIGGSSTGTGDRDGDNARIVLDALPSKYDFPALATSLQKTFKAYKIESISGTDDEIAQSSAKSSSVTKPVEIPFTISVGGQPAQTAEILNTFERSIRPIQVNKIVLSAQGTEVKLDISANTYIQPTKTFTIGTETIKQ